MIYRPEFVFNEHLKYLDGLIKVGKINRLNAGKYLEWAFSLDAEEAGEIHTYWMGSFSERNAV